MLRSLYEKKGVTSFKDSGTPTATAFKAQHDDVSQRPTQSWEYFQTAAEREKPSYRVELARSDRSQCKATGAAKKCGDPATIDKGDIRGECALPTPCPSYLWLVF